MYEIHNVIELIPYIHFSIAPHLHLDFPSALFLSRFPTKSQYIQCPFHIRDMCFPQRLSPQKRGADKSLARPGRKQATAIEDFDFHISYL